MKQANMKVRNILMTTSLLSLAGGHVNAQERPNIVIIYLDDMGYSDISCYGQKKWSTPHIDRLAQEGVRFTDAYSASPVSSPSRAALLTGRYPARMGIQGVFYPDSYTGIPQEELLLSELLKPAGYATGIVGKWHLGSRDKFLPLQNGFDEYFGIPYSNDMGAQVYLRGNEVEDFHVDQSQMTKKYTAEAKDFISRHKDKPFFLYLAHNMMHVPIFCSEEFRGKSAAGIYGDAVLEIDWSVGEVVKELEKQGILENTLIIFASDNGPWLQEGPLGGEALPLREGKTTSYEGGVRIPSIAYWKGRITPVERKDIISTMDWYPTIAHVCNVDIPGNIRLDGYDLSDLLLNNGKRASDAYAYFRDNKDVTGLRVGDWKITLPQAEIKGNFWRTGTAAHDTLLFNLKNDPAERVDLFKKNPSKAKEMATQLDKYKSGFGDVPPALVMTGNHQSEYLRRQRREAIEKAVKEGIQSKENQTDGFEER
ncbi:sulfatase family protein [Dysgonomonas termitidis]